MQAMAIWMFLATAAAVPSLATAAIEAGCGVDRYEPNDERGRAKSTRGKRVEARVCGDDTDWYYVTLEAGSTVSIEADHAPTAELDVELYPPRSRKPQGETRRVDGRVIVRHPVAEDGKHRIRVRSADGRPGAYGLEVVTDR